MTWEGIDWIRHQLRLRCSIEVSSATVECFEPMPYDILDDLGRHNI